MKIRICSDARRAEAEAQECAAASADEDAAVELARRLSFVYPHSDAEALPSKITATELKGRAEPDEDAAPLLPARRRGFTMPDFTRADKPVTGAERGIATHLALQCMDFAKTGSLDAVKDEIERLERQQFLSPREAAAVDAAAIYKLFASPLGARMKSADKLHREFKFSLLCDAGEIYGTEAGEEMLLQGVVDCCLEEHGKLCIIDYKTDAVYTAQEIAQRSAYYAGQLRAYAAALRRIFGMEVSSCVLYYLAAGKSVEIKEKDLQ